MSLAVVIRPGWLPSKLDLVLESLRCSVFGPLRARLINGVTLLPIEIRNHVKGV